MGGSPKAPPPPPAPAVVDDTAANNARLAEEKRNRLAAGRLSTLINGGVGLTATPPAPAKTLLGQ